ncbi:hypothetical protein BV25DRAFT_1801437, partial [Artomyces pyxidatus]
ILDVEDRIIAVLVGTPDESSPRAMEDTWVASMGRVATTLEATRVDNEDAFAASLDGHRRGTFAVLTAGVSYGGGQVVPGNLVHSEVRQSIVDELLANADVSRLAAFQSEALAAYFPKPYNDMCEALDALYEHDKDLKANFVNSAYPTITFNLGPRTVCRAHHDYSNYPGLPCAISALGSFDPDKGGELVLWGLKIRIRFPAASTALISSAGVEHGNTPVQEHETRYSTTQYFVGGLKRWVRHGFRPASSLPAALRKRLDAGQWEAQLDRLSKWGELEEDRKWLIEEEKKRAARSGHK